MIQTAKLIFFFFWKFEVNRSGSEDYKAVKSLLVYFGGGGLRRKCCKLWWTIIILRINENIIRPGFTLYILNLVDLGYIYKGS